MLIHNAAITGSLTYNGIDISDITGSEASVASLNSFSSSILSYTASNNTNINALQAFSSSILTYTASNDSINTTQNNRLSSLETTSGSLINASSSFSTRVSSLESFSSSLDSTFATDAELTSLSSSVTGRLTTDENTITNNSSSFASRLTTDESNISSLQTASGSFSTRTTNLETASGSFSTRVTSNESNITSLNSKTGSYATTGSNIFVNTQYISAANNSFSFTSTASLYTDGGVRVSKDLYVSGTSYFNNVTIYGTQSVQYITSSQLNIGTNIINVNTDTPSIRFGGLSVYDSGSTGLTGSILWDSQNNHWVYSNPSGSSYSGGMFISGPRTSTLGSETGTTSCALMMGQGGDHITSSAIFSYGNATCFYGNSYIDNIGLACFADTVCANTFKSKNLIVCEGSSNATIASSNNEVLRIQGLCSAGMFTSFISGSTVLGDIGNSNQAFSGGSTTAFGINARGSRALDFGTNQSSRLSIAATGESCFSCQACFPKIQINTNISCGNLNIIGYDNSGINIIDQRTAGSGCFYSALTFRDYYLGESGAIRFFHNQGIGPNVASLRFIINDSQKLLLDNTGVGCFSGAVCAPAFVGGTVSGTTGTFSGDVSADNYKLSANSGKYYYLDTKTGNNFLGLDAANTFGLYVGGAKRLGIASTGEACFACQVCAPGIYSSASSRICGNLLISDGSGTSIALYNAGSIRACISMTGNEGDLSLYSSATAKNVYLSAYYDSYINAGKVGIGLTNPSCYYSNQLVVSAGSEGGITIANPGTTGAQYLMFADGTSGADRYRGYMSYNHTDNSMTLATDANTRFTITGTGISCFACQVCAPQYITTQGSSVSYAAGTNYIVWNSEGEICSQDNNTGGTYTTMKTWIADRTGCLTLRFAGYIQSGPTYWAWRVVKNGSTSFVCASYISCLAPGCSTDVHSYRTFQSNIGPVNPGDCVTLQMVSSDGGGSPVNGQGQYLFAKELRLHSTTPNFSAGSPSNVFGDRLGIGTCTPNQTLHLYTNFAQSSGVGSAIQFTSDGAGGDNGWIGVAKGTGNGLELSVENRDIIFNTGATTPFGGTERMRITSAGNVGIGTTSPNPSSPLHIKMCSNSNGDGIRIQAVCSGASGSQPGIAFANVSDAKRWAISLDNTSDIIQITNAAGANALQISQSGIACFACQVCMPATAVISGGGNTLILRKGTGTPALAFAGISDEAVFLVEGMSGGGMKWYTSPAGCTLPNAAWNAKFNMDVNGISTFSCTICAPQLRAGSSGITTTGNLFWNTGDGTDWYIQGQANGPTIRMKYDGGSTNRSGALGWVDNGGGRYEALSWQDSNIYFRVGCAHYLYLPATTGVTPLQVAQNQSCGGYLYVAGDHRIANGGTGMFEYVGTVPAGGNSCVLVIPTRSQGNLHTRATYEIHGVSAEYNLNGSIKAFGGIIAIEYLNNVNVIQAFNLYGTLCGVAASANCIRLSFNTQYNSGASCGVTLRIKLLTTLAWDNYFNIMSMQ